MLRFHPPLAPGVWNELQRIVEILLPIYTALPPRERRRVILALLLLFSLKLHEMKEIATVQSQNYVG
jgi:hypothetical protein